MSTILKPGGLHGIAMSELSCELLMRLGCAAAQTVGRLKKRPAVFYVSHDGRRSAGALEAALCAGICTGGGEAVCLGLMPAGAAALLLEKGDADGGFAVTADDASYEYSGVKLFGERGLPLNAEQLAAIELLMPVSAALPAKSHRHCGVISHDGTAAARYLALAAARCGAPKQRHGLRVAVDCANGAASSIAGTFFTDRGVTPLLLCDRPDGLNINRDCGVCGTDALAEFVREQHCDAGFALDGGGACCIACDETGELLDESRLLAILCEARLQSGDPEIRQKGCAVTDRTNLGFLRYAAERGIPLHSALPEQHSVLDLMREQGIPLGVCGRGAVCFGDLPAADGLMTAAEILRIMQQSGALLSALAGVMEPAPQVSVPVRIPPQWREVWRNDPEIASCIADCEQALGTSGRLLIREHPREPVLTVTVEGSSFQQINTLAMALAEHISQGTPAPQEA